MGDGRDEQEESYEGAQAQVDESFGYPFKGLSGLIKSEERGRYGQGERVGKGEDGGSLH